ncbi:MAG: hypothetical protein K6C13_07820 [Oscillospiraceae bacterium]|nr:hypothetical protein [Oscillospiraceae bacterium]
MTEHGDFFKNMNSNYDVNTAVYRFSVVAHAMGMEDDEDIPIVPEKYRSNIMKAGMTAQIERLLFLFAAGVITDDELYELYCISKGKDISDLLIGAEKFIKENNERTEKERMLPEVFRKVLMCAAVSATYSDDGECLSFDDARNIVQLKCADIVNGYVKIGDIELFKLLADCGESFGNPGEEIYVEQNLENIFGNDIVKNGNTNSNDYPFMMNPKRLVYYSRVFRKPYGTGFIRYAYENGIKADEQFVSRFEKYRRDIKCKFTIDSHERKRHICGDTVNQFDYFLNVEGDRMSIDRRETITVEDDTERSDKELMRLALDKFCGNQAVQNNTVLEVLHDRKKSLFIVKDHDYIPLAPEKFRSRLFDFEEVWGKIISYTAEHPLKIVNGALEIPVEFLDMFDENIREYAGNLIAEQYSRQLGHRGKNKVITKLSTLEANAAENSGAAQQRREQQEKLKQERIKKFNEDRANRDDSSEG